MTKHELAQIERLLEKYQLEKIGAVQNPKSEPRPIDWKGWVMITLGILGVVAAFTMFVFKTNASADLEHEQIRSAQTLANQRIDAHATSQKEILDKLETLNEATIKIGEQLKVRDLPRFGTDSD